LDLPGAFKRRTYVFTAVPAAPSEPPQYRFHAEDDSGMAAAGSPVQLKIGTIVLAPSAPRNEFTVIFRDREETVTRLRDHMSFGKVKSDVAHFSYEGDDSTTAARVPNLLIELYLERRKGIDRGVNQRRAEFLAVQSDSMAAALAAAERALRSQRESSGALDPLIAVEAEFENDNRLRQQLTDLRVQEGALQQLINDIKSGSITARELAAYPQFLSGPISGIVGTLINVETQKRALLVTRTEQDQEVRSLAAQQKNLEDNLLPLAQQTLTGLAAQRAAIENRLSSIEQTLKGAPRNAEAYTRLEREVIDRGKIYAGLQTQLVEARLAAITEGGDVRPLDRAVPPKKPSFPKKSTTLAGGLGGGLFAGTMLAILMGLVGGRMYDARDVERRTGLPAVRFEGSSPLLVGGQTSRTVLVAPINSRAAAKPVAERLVETAMSRSLSATVLDLSSGNLRIAGGGPVNVPRLLTTAQSLEPAFDANAAIRRLEETNDLVIVHLPALSSHEAAAVLSSNRPVLLVAPERRIERDSLQNAIDLLRRVGAPCAGVVLHGDDRRRLRS
jgi:hypothetical protein